MKRIAEVLGWEVLQLPRNKLKEIAAEASPSEKSYEAVLNGLFALVRQTIQVPYLNIVGKDNVAVFRTKDGAEFIDMPEWRMGDFLRAPIREHTQIPWSTVQVLHGKHIFGDGIVALLPGPAGWRQVRILLTDSSVRFVYRAWKGLVVSHPNVTRPLIAWDDGYGIQDFSCISSDSVLQVFTILKEVDLEAEYSIQGLYYQGAPGWWKKARLKIKPGDRVKLWRAGAPLELFYPIAAHLDLGWASKGFAGMLISPRILPFIGHPAIPDGVALAWTRRFKEGQRVVFNRRPDLPTGQSAVEVEFGGFSPIPRSVILGGRPIAITGADYDGDFGLLFPAPEDGGLYVPYSSGQGIQRKALASEDYPTGLHRWAGQLHAARILGSVEVNTRRYLDEVRAQGESPDPRLLENATLMIQVAVDRQKRAIQWPSVELPKPSATGSFLTDLFRIGLPGGKLSPEGMTATQKIVNRWRSWEALGTYTGSQEVIEALRPVAQKVKRLLDATDKRYPKGVLAALAFALPASAPRPEWLSKELRAAELLDRPARLRIYDHLAALEVPASQVTDHPELWLRVASEEELRQVFSQLPFRPAKEEILDIMNGEVQTQPAVTTLDFSDLF